MLVCNLGHDAGHEIVDNGDEESEEGEEGQHCWVVVPANFRTYASLQLLEPNVDILHRLYQNQSVRLFFDRASRNSTWPVLVILWPVWACFLPVFLNHQN